MERAEDREFQIAFFERLTAEKRDFIDALIPLADAYTKRGDYEKGLAIDKKLSILCPDDEGVFYNLACSYSLVADRDQSLAALHQALALGYDDWEHLDKDPDLAYVREDPRFQELEAEFRKP